MKRFIVSKTAFWLADGLYDCDALLNLPQESVGFTAKRLEILAQALAHARQHKLVLEDLMKVAQYEVLGWR